MPYIKVENLKYRYPGTKTLALDGVNFEVEKGSFIGIVGENGAGKGVFCHCGRRIIFPCKWIEGRMVYVLQYDKAF